MAITTQTKGTARDREFKNFLESPARGPDFSAREVVVTNGSSDPIPVDPTTRGENKSEYNEISLAGLASGDIISFTVPVGKGVDLKVGECSGENLAIYEIQINGSTRSKKRTWWTEFNADFFLSELNAVAGDVVKIVVENKSNSTSFFNGTLHYNEYDL